MGAGIQFGGYLHFEDGTKFVEVESIPELVIPAGYEQDHEPMFTAHDEVSFTLQIRPFGIRRLKRALMYWKAAGPLRWKQLKRAENTFRRAVRL